jgi:hypothetical protein
MSLSAPTPLPLTSGVESTELGGFSLAAPPPDRYSDHVAATTDRSLVLQWQDNKDGKWSKEWWINLGTQGQLNMIRQRHGVGMYRSRQFKLVFDAAVLWELSAIEDDLVVLK